MSQIQPKLTLLQSFIVSHLIPHITSSSRHTPLIVGINGIQGSGKTTLVTALAQHLSSPSSQPSSTDAPQVPAHQPLRTVTLSLDDFYHPHTTLQDIRQNHATNRLLQTRGQPGTHDVRLLVSTLQALKEGKDSKIPRFDKSAHSGEGDRAPEEEWETVQGPVDVVLLEGWCLGFRHLGPERTHKWEQACSNLDADLTTSPPGATDAKRAQGRLGAQKLPDIMLIDENLREYDVVTDMVDVFVHLDAEETWWVYDWRLEQEESLRKSKGSGMTDEQVVKFVNGCECSCSRCWLLTWLTRIDYPSYELYTAQLREGVFEGKKGRQLRVVIGRDRQPIEHKVL